MVEEISVEGTRIQTMNNIKEIVWMSEDRSQEFLNRDIFFYKETGRHSVTLCLNDQ